MLGKVNEIHELNCLRLSIDINHKLKFIVMKSYHVDIKLSNGQRFIVFVDAINVIDAATEAQNMLINATYECKE